MEFNNFLKPVEQLIRLGDIAKILLTKLEERIQATSLEAVKQIQKKPRICLRFGQRILNHRGPYVCDLCGKICKNRNSIYYHMWYQHFTAPRFICDLCPKSIKTKGNLAKHIKMHMKFKALVCDVCGFKTIRKHALRDHKLTHGKKTECPICNKFVNVMKEHMRAVHAKVPCKICWKKMSKVNLIAHVRRMHEKNEKNHRCTHDNCSEAFGTKLELNRHVLRAHNKGKVFECHCGSVYKTSQSLRNHKNNSHKSEVQTCKICGLKHKSLHNLRQHWNKKHAEAYGRFQILKLQNSK